ncbi:MAG: ATP-binding protein [Bacillota bacterium]|nr:ATP-binding protein [Bacillota bacterium]
MIKIIVGEKGTGKTKTLLDSVHAALNEQSGNVVFINKGDRHKYDLNYKVRLINTEDYSIESYDAFYGLICGILSQNFDITNMFVDSITKIVGFNDIKDLENLMDKISAICEKANVSFAITISVSPDELTEGLKKYL